MKMSSIEPAGTAEVACKYMYVLPARTTTWSMITCCAMAHVGTGPGVGAPGPGVGVSTMHSSNPVILIPWTHHPVDPVDLSPTDVAEVGVGCRQSLVRAA